jgi:uncharacterized metal-binding protein YceD (DUF177 family)
MVTGNPLLLPYGAGLMKVHVLQIPDGGKQIEGEDPSAILDLNDDHARAVAPIHYNLNVGVSEDGLWAHGTVGTEIECQCVRCLSKFRRPLDVPDFAHQVPLEGREMVDLTEQVREDILLALPAHPTCDWDGKTACKASFTTAGSAAEPLEDGRDVWKDLDNLKL